MGVPKFYRWISERYPNINQLIENASKLPEFDNLYLDLNGVIHANTHPANRDVSEPLTEREMMLGIFRSLDRMIFEIAKPKKLLFIAVDGVAPRAKLNQQRSRRFRAAKDMEESIQAARAKGEQVDLEELFDSNCITPGTEFMDKVNEHLKYYVRTKFKENPVWRDVQVILSGHDVPGEGEHKIMQFIREQRASAGYDPNTRHCMYGQDADLIMLGLVSHEPHFTLLREVIDFGAFQSQQKSSRQTIFKQTQGAQFQLLHLSVLREYLELDLCWGFSRDLYDPERIVDDFVFLTFLVGNDFLPHLPTLDIGENAFDLLFEKYKQVAAPKAPGEQWKYLVCNGELQDLDLLEQLFTVIGLEEDRILTERAVETAQFNARRRRFDRRDGTQTVPTEEEEEALERAEQEAFEAALRERMGTAYVPPPQDPSVQSTPNFRGRYYYSKFNVTELDVQFHTKLRTWYLEGLMWCLAYYVKGCISWTWYYPAHYGPMLSDMNDLRTLAASISFELGNPFRPFEQLLGCLPPASAKLLPRAYRDLMSSPNSTVIDFYPKDFKIDMDGKRNPWEAVVLLPFIDEQRLLEAVHEHVRTGDLSMAERTRNSFGKVLHFQYDPAVTTTIHSCNPAIGLPDIICCQSSCRDSHFDIRPGTPFTAALLPGCRIPFPGFPSLHVIPIVEVSLQPLKLNIFGSESRYNTLVLTLQNPAKVPSIEEERELLGRSVYVNYPALHEARVVAVSREDHEVRLVDGSPVLLHYDEAARQKWRALSSDEQSRYLRGRRVVGNTGLNIGDVNVRVRVRPLQGMKRDPKTGALLKEFGTAEAEVPFQLAVENDPAPDLRYEETSEQPVEQRFPIGATIACVQGDYAGLVGEVVQHTAELSSTGEPLVTVKLYVDPEEPPFGYAVVASVQDQYLKAGQVANALNLHPSVLGRLTGSVNVEPGRHDIGLNLKLHGKFTLPGYVRKALSEDGNDTNVWKRGDSVHVVGSIEDPEAAFEKEASRWEYSVRTVQLLLEYKSRFPQVFQVLSNSGYERVLNARTAFGMNGVKLVEAVMEWMKTQEFFHLPRVPVSTVTLSREAIKAIERAADVRTSFLEVADDQKKSITRNLPVSFLFLKDSHLSVQVPLSFQDHIRPLLGDRVMNLTAIGVPFGLKGTVVAIHYHSGYVEVVFDKEVNVGKSLQGSCSNFRGLLMAWTDVLRLKQKPVGELGRDNAIRQLSEIHPHPARSRSSSPSGRKANRVEQPSAKRAPRNGAERKASPMPAAPTAAEAGAVPAAKSTTNVKSLLKNARAHLQQQISQTNGTAQPAAAPTPAAAAPAAAAPAAAAPATTATSNNAGRQLLQALQSGAASNSSTSREQSAPQAAPAPAPAPAAAATTAAPADVSVEGTKLMLKILKRGEEPKPATAAAAPAAAAPVAAPAAAPEASAEQQTAELTKSLAAMHISNEAKPEAQAAPARAPAQAAAPKPASPAGTAALQMKPAVLLRKKSAAKKA